MLSHIPKNCLSKQVRGATKTKVKYRKPRNPHLIFSDFSHSSNHPPLFIINSIPQTPKLSLTYAEIVSFT